MRVISGIAGGRRLKEPQGMDIRPTTDKVKEAIFDIVQFDIEGRTAVDLFAGTGQLGIEALSRGAERVYFTEDSPKAISVLRENLQFCGLEDGAEVFNADGIAWLAHCGRKFDLAFLDPPYDTPLLDRALETIFAFDIMNKNGIIICESRLDRQIRQIPMPYVFRKEYRYGKIKLTRIVRQAD